MARLLAVLAAVAMIVGAFAVRTARDSDDTEGANGRLVFICDDALGEVCAELRAAGVDVTVEPAAVTADRFGTVAEDELHRAAWLTAGPWPAMVNAAREAAGRAPLFRTEPVASTQLAIVADTTGGVTACLRDDPSWRCVAEETIAGFRLAGPPHQSSLRLLMRAAVAQGYFEGPFARNDLIERPEVVADVGAVDRRIDEARRSGGASLELLLANPAFADGFVVPAAEAERLLGVAANADRFALFMPDPAVFVTATLGTLAGRDEPRVDENLFATFQRLGWQRPVADDGLPSPGVLEALREIVG